MTNIITTDEAHHALSEWVYEYADRYSTEPHKVPLTGKTLESWRLRLWANALSLRFWGVEFDGIIEVVHRKWKAQLASYGPSACGKYHTIRFSRPVLSGLTLGEIKGDLAHELVHWRLQTTGKPYDDVDTEFIEECIRVGAPFSYERGAFVAWVRYLHHSPDTRIAELRKEGLSYM